MNKEVSKVVIAYPDRLKVWIQDFRRILQELRNGDRNKLYGMGSHKYKKVVEGAKKLMQDC